ncbi:MAG TPA: ABC transporter substrate-binding protein [Stellaceae bacterium]|nr:ABC transporter substrate-binding protein [Stellaceae bacterium]
MKKALWCALAVLAGAPAALAAINTPAHAETLNVGEPQATVFDFVPLHIGVEKGIFARHGVDVKVFDLRGAAEQQQALISGAIDVGLGSGPAMSFSARGATVKGIAEMASKPLVMVLAVNAKESFNTPADLKGKTISIASYGSITEWMIRELQRQQGIPPDAVKLVALGANSSQMAALRTGQVDGMPIDIFSATKYEQEGFVRILVNFGDIAPHFILHVIFANDQAIEKKPDALRRFLAGWFDTIKYMNTHKDESVKIAADMTKVPADVISALYNQVMPMFTETGHFDRQALTVLAHSFVELKLLPKEPDMSTLYTEKFLAPAKAQK